MNIILSALLILTLILCGCQSNIKVESPASLPSFSNSTETTISTPNEKDALIKPDSIHDQNIPSEKRDSIYHNTDYAVSYDALGKKITLETQNKLPKIFEMASEPKFSSNHNQFIYLTGEQDSPGSLYVYDLTSSSNKLLLSPKDDGSQTPKDADWLSDKKLLVILGYGWGHSSFGGDVYSYDLETQKTQLILTAPEDQSYIGIHISEDSVVLQHRSQAPETSDKIQTIHFKKTRFIHK